MWTRQIQADRERFEVENGTTATVVVVRPALYSELCLEAGGYEADVQNLDGMVVAVSEGIVGDFQFYTDVL